MKYVIVGGDAAGMSAAMQIVRNDPQAEIVTLEKGGIYSYGQCGLPYAISGVIESTDELIARKTETFRDRYGIDAKIYYEVNRIDPKNKTVYGKKVKTGEPFAYHYDKLLIATGASPIIPDWTGVDLEHVHTLKTIESAHEIMESMTDDIQQVTIVGGGYIGLEMAESFKILGKKVRIIQRGSQLAAHLDEEMAAYILDEAEKHDIEVITDENVTEIQGKGKVETIQTDKNCYDTDMVLIAIGVKPNTEFLRETGIQLGVKDAIQINRNMETNIKDVYAAGDCAVQYNRVKQADDYIPLGTNANKQGRIAGMNMIGNNQPFAGITGTSIFKFMDLAIGSTGLSEQVASELGVPYEVTKIEAHHIVTYHPGAAPLTIKLVYRKDNGQLLGGQVVGEAGVDKRVDVLATALFNQMTIHDLENLDLSYAPPFNSTWDPVQQAARRRPSS